MQLLLAKAALALAALGAPVTVVPADLVLPTPTPAPAWVEVCGTALCADGQTFPLDGASVLAGPSSPGPTVALAQQAGLDLVRVVDFLDLGAPLATAPYDPARWRRVDALIAAAGRGGLRVELDLSAYRNLLLAHGVNPYTADWQRFVRWVATRRNTVSHRRYADDPTIALVAFAGEPDVPSPARGYTAAQLTAFYRRTLGQWRQLDHRHLLTPGGFLYLDQPHTVDWRAVAALPEVDVVALHDYGPGDDEVALPAVATFTHALGKPWITEELGREQSVGDAVRAAWFSHVYGQQLRYGSAGAAFWNLGPQTTSPTYDVNPTTPLTWRVVQAQRAAPLSQSVWLRTSDPLRYRD